MRTDSSLQDNNLNSRHPVIIGLRNLLRTACLNDITTLTIPLLLSHKVNKYLLYDKIENLTFSKLLFAENVILVFDLEMTEKMTVAWCVKRAELVFKCIKGFMMEMGSWGGAEIKTLQFLLPRDIDPDVFMKLTAMLATIFRVSNPIRGS